MKFIWNREIRVPAILLAGITGVFTAAAWRLAGWPAGILCLAACLLCGAVALGFAGRNARRVIRLGEDLDRLLHGQENVDFSQYREGAVYVLSSEIQKMTLRMREQADCLKRDQVKLSDALADIAHQLRTPLTSAYLLCTLLAREEDPQRREALLGDLTALLRRIEWLVDALLKISRLDAGTVEFRTESVPVRGVVMQAAEPLAVMMELRGVSLETRIGEERFLGDAAWTAEALGNLLKNCAEHTPPGGTVTVTAEENALYTQIRVRDTGEGFCPEDLPHLFERFYKGQNAAENSIGIGLALARGIIAAQNGTIRAQNADPGAEFTVRFYKSTV